MLHDILLCEYLSIPLLMDIKLVSSLFVFLIVNSVLLHFICVKLSFGYILFMRKIKNLVSYFSCFTSAIIFIEHILFIIRALKMYFSFA